MTGTAIISRALRLIGALASGETLPAADGADALVTLNAMLDAWRVESLLRDALVRTTQATVANTQTYTIGPAATIVLTPTPSVIEGAGYLIPGSSPSQEVPIAVLTDQAYEAITIKGQTDALPQAIWYKRGAPNGTITVWPNVTQIVTLVLYTRTALAQWTTLATDLTLVPAAEEAVVFQLALRLCPEYGRPVTPEIAELASSALGRYRRANVKLVELGMAAMYRPESCGAYDINSDT